MGRSDGFQALLDRAAANTVLEDSPPIDRIFRPTAKENLGMNQLQHRQSYQDQHLADTSSFGAPGHDAPGLWTGDRRKNARERNYQEDTLRDKFEWNSAGRNQPSYRTSPQDQHRPLAASPSSTPSRSSSSYSRDHRPIESLHLRHGDTDERFQSPRHAIRQSPRDEPQQRHFYGTSLQDNHMMEGRCTLTESEWKLREAELEVSLQRKEHDFRLRVEKFERYRQDESNQIEAEYRSLKGMQQDIDNRIKLLGNAEKEMNDRESKLAEEQQATGEAIADLERQTEQWERQKHDRTRELSSMEAQSRDERNKLASIKQQVATFKRESEDQKKELREELEFARSEIVAATREREKVESQLLSDQKLLTAVQTQVDQQKRELSLKTEQVQSAGDKLTATIHQIEVAQRQMRSLEQELVSARDRHGKLKAETAEMERHLIAEEERWRLTEDKLKDERSKLEMDRQELTSRMHVELEHHQAVMAEERSKNDDQLAAERKSHDEKLNKEREDLELFREEQEQRLTKAKHHHDEQVRNFQERRHRIEQAFKDEHQLLNNDKKMLTTEREQIRVKLQSVDQHKRETEEKFTAALSEERRQTSKIRQELEACTKENKRLRHDLNQAQQKAFSNQQRVKDLSLRLEKQASILETKSANLQKERADMDNELQERSRALDQKEATFRDQQQKHSLEALLRRQAEKKASTKAVFTKWAGSTSCQDAENKLVEAERREYRTKQDFQARLRESREKEKELFEEIEALKANMNNFSEREKAVREANDRIRLMAKQLQEKDMELRARESQLMNRWIKNSDDGASIGESSISTHSALR